MTNGGTNSNRFGAAWIGTITVGGTSPIPAGIVSFGLNSDDGSVIFVDVNLDGSFSPSELVVNDAGGHAPTQKVGAVNFPAGTYPIYIGYYEGSGGGSMEAKVGAGGTVAAPVAYASQTIINPSDTAQAGLWTSTTVTPVNSLTVTTTGTGALILDAANTYNGPTTVTSGKLVAATAASLGSNAAVVISPNATLDAQTGVFSQNFSLAGTLSSSIGTTTISGTLALVPALAPVTTVASNAGQNVITVAISNTALVPIGSTVTGTNVPPGAIVTAVNATTVTINVPLVNAIAIGTTISIGNASIGGAGSQTITAPISGPVGIAKIGSGTAVLAPSNNLPESYTGNTVITGGGKLQLTMANELPTAAAVILGNATAANATTATGNLDLQSFNQTIGGLIVNSDVATANNINIAGGTLTANIPASNSLIVGSNLSTTDKTTLTFTGSGTLSIVGANTTNTGIQIGNPVATSANVDTATVDMTGLAVANITIGTLRVSDNNGNNSTTAAPGQGIDTLTLAPTSSLTAANLDIGDIGAWNLDNSTPTALLIPHVVNLGSVSNVFKVDAINVGANGTAANAIRSSGILHWAAGVSTGTLNLNNQAGTGGAALNMINSATGTANSETSLVDFGTHTVTASFSAITMSARSANTGNATSTFNFGAGTLGIGSLSMTNRSGANTGTSSSTMNLTGGTVSIGSITMAQNSVVASSNANVQSATINIGGTATVTVGSALNMGFASGTATNVITSVINVTGGSLIVSGGIIKGANTGVANASINLNGGHAQTRGGSGKLPPSATPRRLHHHDLRGRHLEEPERLEHRGRHRQDDYRHAESADRQQLPGSDLRHRRHPRRFEQRRSRRHHGRHHRLRRRHAAVGRRRQHPGRTADHHRHLRRERASGVPCSRPATARSAGSLSAETPPSAPAPPATR